MFRVVGRSLAPPARTLLSSSPSAASPAIGGAARAALPLGGQSRPFFSLVRSIGGRFFGRLGAAAVLGTSGGYGAFLAFQQYLDSLKASLPSNPFSSWDMDSVQLRLEGFQEWMKGKEREKARRDEEIEDELPSALKNLARISKTAPALPRGQPNFGNGELMFISKKLIDLRTTLSSIADLRLQLPTIVVIGAQSSGKSSVLEAIVGHEFLPKGNNMVTRRPLELTLIYTPYSNEEYGEFPDSKMTKIKDFTKIRDTIAQMNASVPEEDHVSDDPIKLRIYSPNVPDLNLVDLPGYIRVTSDKQPPELRDRIFELCKKYIQEPNLILAVSAADVDLANSDSIRESRRIDPQGIRTLGVLTKMDQIRGRDGAELLRQNDYSLGLGYIGVVSRPPGSGGKYEDADVYFHRQSDYNEILDSVGIARLRERLVKVLEEHMFRSLSSMAEKVKHELQETKYVLKVEFNDQRTSPEYFLATLSNRIKSKFEKFSAGFNQREIARLIQLELESRILGIIEDNYWNIPDLRSPLDPKYLPVANPVRSGAFEDPRGRESPLAFLQRSLEVASSSFLRLGIGKLSTQLIVSHLKEQVRSFLEEPLFEPQPEVRAKIDKLANHLLKTRDISTSEFVESNVKAFRRGVDIKTDEWQRAYYRTQELMNFKIATGEKALGELYAKHGKKNLEAAIKALMERHQLERQRKAGKDLPPLGPVEIKGEPISKPLLDAAQEAQALKFRMSVLQIRKGYIKKNGWKQDTAFLTCPEIYLVAMADKLSHLCAQSIYSELWDDFAFHFPLQVDESLYYKISEEEKKRVINNDEKVKRQIMLQQKKDKLEVANAQLNDLLRHYNQMKFGKDSL